MSFEETIEETFYDEVLEAKPEERSGLEKQLDKIWRVLEQFVLSDEIKTQYEEELRQQQISPESDIGNFTLRLLDVLTNISKDDSLGEFLTKAYIGCLQCISCLKIVKRDDNVCGECAQMLASLGSASRVIGEVLHELGVSVPDSGTIFHDYESTLEDLPQLTDDFLCHQHEYEFLRMYKVLIKDYEIVNEISQGLQHLREQFEELRFKHSGVSRRHSEMLFTGMDDSMEEKTDLSLWCCWESSV